mgnify:CR=1 FL=1
MGHTRAADGLNEGLLDDAVLDVQAQLASTLLGSTPAHTMGVAADILNFIRLDPLALFGDGAGPCLGPFVIGHIALTCAEYSIIIFSPLHIVRLFTAIFYYKGSNPVFQDVSLC